jgi:hypothetical protein
MKLIVPLLLLSGASSLLAQDSARPNFTGTWRLDQTKSEIRSKVEAPAWAIHQDGNSIEIDQEIKGHVQQLKCGTTGANCKGKPDGESGEVMFYYNGAMLVETDFLSHDRVVKKRLRMGPDGKTMEIEVLHVNPQGPVEKWVFEKQADEVKSAAK